jgi:hypothetical protein
VVTFGLLGQAYYFRRVGSPRPVIVYRMSRPTPLVANHMLRDAAGDLQVAFRGEPVLAPYLAALAVECKSRRDLADEDFYRQKPLVFDFGAPIVTVLFIDPSRTGIPAGNLATDGSKLRVGPCLIHPGPVLSIEVLTEGAPKLKCDGDDNPLINIEVRDRIAEIHRARRRQRRLLAGLTLVATIGFSVVIANSHLKEAAGFATIGSFVIATIAALSAATDAFITSRSADAPQEERTEP